MSFTCIELQYAGDQSFIEQSTQAAVTLSELHYQKLHIELFYTFCKSKGIKLVIPIRVCVDNIGAIYMTTNHVTITSRTKYVDVGGSL